MAIEPGYYRYPAIHGDRVVFVTEDDLWRVSANGGPAIRISANPGQASRPALSPDGALLAYVSSDEGHPEVFVMPADGGSARRLTYFGAMTTVVGWRPDGKVVLVATDTGQPFAGQFHIHEIPVDGSPGCKLPFGPALGIAVEPTDGSGAIVLARNGGGRGVGDPARWKRYRGGRSGRLWIDRKGTGKFSLLLGSLEGEMANPMWLGGRVYFLSDHQGIANLYSCRPTGSDLRRHTHHDEFYIRFPQTDGTRIVYACGADLYLYDPETDQSSPIDVQMHSSRPQRNRKFVSAAQYLERYAVHPKGHSLCVTTRGKPFTFAFWEEAVAQHGKQDGVRYRHAQWLSDGKRLVAVTDESGEEQLVTLGPGGRTTKIELDFDLGRAVALKASPAGPDRIALTNHRYEVIVIDLGKKKACIVDRSRFDRTEHLAWSGDGRWLVYSLHESFHTVGLKILDTRTGRVTQLTRPDFRDLAPVFDPLGKYLYFISHREYDPVYDQHVFDLGFPRGMRLLAITLRRETASPFEPSPRAPGTSPTTDDEAGSDKNQKNNKNKKNDGDGDAAAEAEPVEIDLKGIEDRVVAFPIPEGVYGQLGAIPGKVLFTSFSIQGALGDDFMGLGEPPAKGRIEAFDLKELKRETLVNGVTDFALSTNGKVMVYRAGNRLRALPAGKKPKGSQSGDNSQPKATGRESGWIDLGRVRVSIDPGREWVQMFREAWRLQRDQFWTEDMSGLDWERVYQRYRPLVDRAASRSEFSDLMWEMQGELGTSHAYEMGGDYRPEPKYHQGFPGADLTYDDEARVWRFERIPRGDSWMSAGASPLAAPGLNVKPNDRLLAVGGRKLGGRLSPGQCLVNCAGQHTLLTVADAKGRHRRTITIKALTNETGLRYRDWVEHNRWAVHEATEGRAGYLHIPDMGPAGFAEFHRYYLAELNRPALVVDVRFNRGGHVSQLLLEKLLRKRVGYDLQRWGEPMSYPDAAVAGPLVALTNEYAGSDGDIFSHCFKLYGIGPLIGKRTWGGVIGIWPRHALVDGTVTTQPEFSFWFTDVGFGVENYGTDPDIEVEIKPQDHAAGRDTQLERGITEIKKLLRRNPGKAPDLSRRPKLVPPRLKT